MFSLYPTAKRLTLAGDWFGVERTDMQYLRVEWRHSDPGEPVTLLSELDDDGREVRKIEVFRDGHCGYASAEENSPSTELGEKPLPSFEQIGADAQFQPVQI